LDDPVAEILHLLDLEEFTMSSCGTPPRSCAPWSRLATFRPSKIEGLHKHLRAAHEEIRNIEEEKVRLQQASPTDEVGGQALRLERLSSGSPSGSVASSQDNSNWPSRCSLGA